MVGCECFIKPAPGVSSVILIHDMLLLGLVSFVFGIILMLSLFSVFYGLLSA